MDAAVNQLPEVIPGYPDKLVPKDDAAAKVLKTRSLTKLYNEHPTWLANAHQDLDAAVAAAYGWPEDIDDDDALARLFDLNQSEPRHRRTAPRLGARRLDASPSPRPCNRLHHRA